MWRGFSEREHFNRQPLVQRPQPAGCLLFVGLNPSYSVHGWARLLSRNDAPTAENLERIFAFPGPSDDSPIEMCSLDAFALEKYPFYRLQWELAKKLQLPFGHLDMFITRQTDQARVRASIIEKGPSLTLTAAGHHQFNTFRSLLEQSMPKLVIVANALACDIFKKEFSPKYSPPTGAYEIYLAKNRVPVLLSGMLTGQRALDRYSRERLFWHAHQLVNSM